MQCALGASQQLFGLLHRQSKDAIQWYVRNYAQRFRCDLCNYHATPSYAALECLGAPTRPTKSTEESSGDSEVVTTLGNGSLVTGSGALGGSSSMDMVDNPKERSPSGASTTSSGDEIGASSESTAITAAASTIDATGRHGSRCSIGPSSAVSTCFGVARHLDGGGRKEATMSDLGSLNNQGGAQGAWHV